MLEFSLKQDPSKHAGQICRGDGVFCGHHRRRVRDVWRDGHDRHARVCHDRARHDHRDLRRGRDFSSFLFHLLYRQI